MQYVRITFNFILYIIITLNILLFFILFADSCSALPSLFINNLTLYVYVYIIVTVCLLSSSYAPSSSSHLEFILRAYLANNCIFFHATVGFLGQLAMQLATEVLVFAPLLWTSGRKRFSGPDALVGMLTSVDISCLWHYIKIAISLH